MPVPPPEGDVEPVFCLCKDSAYESDLVFDEILHAVEILLKDIPKSLPDVWYARAIQQRAAAIEMFLSQQSSRY